MTSVLVESRRPAGSSALTVHTGSPAADVPFNFPAAVQVRVWDDGTLAGFESSGSIIVMLRPDSYWGFLWQ